MIFYNRASSFNYFRQKRDREITSNRFTFVYLGSGTRRSLALWPLFLISVSFSPFSADYKIYDRICHVQNIISGDGGNGNEGAHEDDGERRRRQQQWSSSSSSPRDDAKERSMSQTLTTT